MMRYNLLRLGWLKALLKSRWPQWIVMVIALVVFVLSILTGFFGTPVGSRNFGVIFVWIAWWALLMLVAVPIFGRGWCAICPIPLPGEWIQRGAVLGPGGKNHTLGWRWPNKLRNIWVQNFSFLLVALFSTAILTLPHLTAIVLSAFLFIATGVSMVFERRAFCRYLCPVGGFIGLYAQLAPMEIRVINSSICASHTEKTCYTGNDTGYGCPWQVFPPGLVKNTYCGACLECIRSCPHDNLAINIRPFGTDLSETRSRKLDEAYKAFIMLGSALLYSAVLLGPWGQLKMAAFSIGSGGWWLYAASFLLATLLLLPGLFWLSTWLGKKLSGSRLPTRRLFVQQAYALIPLGLFAWVAFSLSFVFANLSYIGMVLSDPFGWGWNLLGIADLAWVPFLTGITPFLQVGVLTGGFAWAANTARKIALESSREKAAALLALPVIVFLFLLTLLMMGLLVA